MSIRLSARRHLCCLVLLGAGLAGCGDKPAAVSAGPGQTPPKPVEVVVLTVRSTQVPQQRELVGRLSATRSAEVRARIAGILKERVYTEGTDVQAGELLFQIEPAPFQAQVNSRKAALNQARVNADNAKAKAERFAELAGKGVIARQDLEDAQAAARSAAAAVQQARADLEQTELNLLNARVVAPIAGRAGKAMVTEGALVGQGEVTLLTTVEQINPIHVNFSQSQSEYERLRQLQGMDGEAGVRIKLADGSDYAHPGTLSFTDLAVDPQTGAIALRATLPNPDYRLLPGMFVNVVLTQGAHADVFLVPQSAVQRDATGPFALVVGVGNKVERRNLSLDGSQGSDWIVNAGLAEGEQLIVSGIQKARPGSEVTVTAADAGSAPASPH